jgi:hypothetical protein
MTVQLPVNDRVVSFTPAAGTTVMDTDFPVLAAADLAVWRERGGVATMLTLNTDYALTLIGNQTGARITLVVGSLAGDVYALRGARPRARGSSFVEGQLRADDINGELAGIIASIQELGRDVDLAIGPQPNAPSGPVTAKSRGVEQVLWLDIEETTVSTPKSGRGRLQARAVSGGTPKLFWRSAAGSEIELTATGDASAAAAAAAASAAAASGSAASAAASAATINLPSPSGNANKALVVNGAGTGYTLSTGGGDVTTAQLNAAIDGIKAGVDASYDTLAEVATGLAARVRVDADQGLSLAQQIQGRANLAAASPDAFASNNILLNGAHQISQSVIDTAVTSTGYVTDQWEVSRNGTMATLVQRVTDAPAGFAYSLKCTISTAQASLSAGNYLTLSQPVEQMFVRRLGLGGANHTTSILFGWFKSSVAGTYAVTVRDYNGSATTQSWIGSLTISAANTWEYKTFVVSGTANGTWGSSETGKSAVVGVTLVAASSIIGAAGWQSADVLGISGHTNFAATVNNTFQFTGLGWIGGSIAPSSEQSRFFSRRYADDLRETQRYWEKSYNYSVLPGSASAAGRVGIVNPGSVTVDIYSNIKFGVQKRVAPTLTAYDWLTGSSGAATFDNAGENGSVVFKNLASGGSAFIQWVANARM